MLQAHRIVLDRLGDSTTYWTENGATEVALGIQECEDMGTPDKITVTIEPGDKLND